MHIHHIFLIYSSVDGHLGLFLILAIINTMNIGVHVSFQMNVFIFFAAIPRNEVPGSCGRTIFTF